MFLIDLKGSTMKDKTTLFEKVKCYLFYGGIDKEEYDRVREPVAKANLKSLRYWSVLVSLFWIYCLLMSLKADDYARCRSAYSIALGICIFSYVCARFLVTRFPNTLTLFKFIFRLSLIGGGIGIAICQWDVRSLTMFAVAIMSPSIFVDSTAASLVVHGSALIVYFIFGKNVIEPDIFSWGLGNYILFSIFGLLIGNAINRDRFERYVYAEYEKELAEIQMRYAYFDRMTELGNRRAYEDMLTTLADNPPSEYCIIMADINRLKETNDSIGHGAGDELITGTSECLKVAFEGIDSIYRIGGDEFCVIMNGSVEKAKQCITQLESLLSKWQGRYINGISISTGLASNKDHNDVESITAEADHNMYESKRNYYMRSGNDRRSH